ncbi:hypothetical protein F5Y10DRAFT_257954 [Nemania abortiva]|nr:hypothetical protein F5Y10DRAFT_257954 [Nemania abortiva]
MAHLVSEYVLQCLQDFQDVSSKFDDLSDTTRQKFLDEFSRFKLWTGNIGAHKKGRSSLDWRLRDASHLKTLVVDLLTDLKSTLQDALSVFNMEPDTETNPIRHQDSASASEVPHQLDDFDKVDDNTEILEIVADIGDIIGCLLRLSLSIRNPAPHDHFMSSKFTDTSHFEEYDVEHVKTKLPNIENALARRLGKAISQRRQYFKYRESHHQKLNAGLDLESTGSEAGIQSTVASSIPLEFKDSKGDWSGSSQQVEELSNSGGSQTSYASSDHDSGRLKIPPLPKQAGDGPFECPFCYMIILISTTIQWKKHVNSDLRPYICLEPDCSTPEQQYARLHDWLEHLDQKHWLSFRCPYSCDAADFTSPSQLKTHIRRSHPELSSQKDLTMILGLCERPRAWPEETKCPLCLHTLHSKREYARHVGRHQTELALFALPNTGEDMEQGMDEDTEEDVEEEEDRRGLFDDKMESRPRLSKEEVEKLEKVFQENPKPSSSVKTQLADGLGLERPRVNNWFQNRRAKAKQERKQEEYEARRLAEESAVSADESV